jgi:holliday junction DNA helicase RuvA
MLVRIRGVLESVEGNRAVVALGDGRAFEVLVPTYLGERLNGRGGAASVGGEIELHTLEYLESLNQGAAFLPRILGFASARERAFFELLTSVKGLGNKRALRALSVEPAMVARWIAERDARALQRLPEIGPKLADLIVHELKGKVDDLARGAPAAVEAAPTVPAVEVKSPRAKKTAGGSGGSGGPGPAAAAAVNPPVRQTVDALVALGEDPVNAERMVAAAIERARSGGDAVPVTTADLLTAAYAAR